MDALRVVGNIVYLLVISLGLALLGWMLGSQWELASFFAEPARVALVFRAWTGVFIVALLAVIILRRIREVEAAWEETFGNEWVGYCQHTWRLIPWVY